MDPYELLNVTPSVTEKALNKAYKRAALKWHPDKNTSNAEAASAMFDEIRKAYDILSDSTQRTLFDQKKKAEIATKERDLKLTGKRKRLKEDLQRREQENLVKTAAAKLAKTAAIHIQKKMKTTNNKIDDLRRKGELQRIARDQMIKTKLTISKTKEPNNNSSSGSGSSSSSSSSTINNSTIVVVKWKKKQGIEHNTESLKTLLETEFGLIETILIGKKGNRAIVEFKSSASVEKSIQCASKFNLRITKQNAEKKKKKIAVVMDATPDFEASVLEKLRRA
jgi:DnaJ homolog subfamily C member 17